MPRKAEEMSPVEVRRLNEPGLHFVGGVAGLALQVLPARQGADGKETQARTWVLRATIGGKRRDMGLGGFPDVGVGAARDAARVARGKIREGIDPIAEARAAKSALLAQRAATITFKEAATKYMAAHDAGWKNPKHRAQWASTLETYAYPKIGSLSVGDIELPHILEVLEPIWKEKTETASRVRGRIEVVLSWATTRGYRQGLNPARWRGNLDNQLGRPSKLKAVKPRQALPVMEVGGFMKTLRAANGMGARALEFAILTATRSGETRGATWAEIDLVEGVWTIPASRMKAKKEHRVPLSPAAKALLQALPRMVGTDLVFTAGRRDMLSDMTLSAVLKRMGVNAVPHGFRSTFRDWAAERTGYPREVCEMALAHTVQNETEAAYFRTDLFEKRKRLMKDWATFLSVVQPTGQVTPIRTAG
jgi:integrase